MMVLQALFILGPRQSFIKQRLVAQSSSGNAVKTESQVFSTSQVVRAPESRRNASSYTRLARDLGLLLSGHDPYPGVDWQRAASSFRACWRS